MRAEKYFLVCNVNPIEYNHVAACLFHRRICFLRSNESCKHKPTMWLTLLFLGTAALFLAMTSSTLFHSQWARRLPALSELGTTDCGGTNDDRVQCSVIVAARDEELRIEDTVRHLLTQCGVRLEVIVVDDRSTDRTEKILERLVHHDDRVHTQRVDELPDGWLGKCYACHLGAARAKGDWILFTDADCWLKPDVISRALRVAEREGADHVTLTPGIDAKSLGALAWHLAFLITLANWFSGVNRDRPKAYLGMGAFNLVRASAYRECGGYEALRLTILDDVRLGLLLRRAGKRTRGFIGGDDVECHWGTTVRGMIQIMEKNYFAAMDFRLAVALVGGFGGMLFWGAAIVGPFTGTSSGVAAGLAMLTLSVPAYVFARRLGWSGASALLTPLIFPVLFYAMLNSAWVTTRQGGVSWRNTFYSLDELRTGAVR
jgi:glycosyltransferase involved in cell wall biosynthesis